MTRRCRIILMSGVLLAAEWMPPGADAEAETTKVLVTTGAHEFSPQTLTIRVGDRVTWINQDHNAHSLVSAGSTSRHTAQGPEALFINATLLPGSRYTHAFTVGGTYYYFCADHMQVWGVVEAKE